MNKSDKIREHFRKNPDAKVADVVKKFEASAPMVYKLRKEVLAEWRPPELLPTPDVSVWLRKEVEAITEEDLDLHAITMEPSDVDRILEERGDRYGTFESNANTSQQLKNVLRSQDGWYRLSFVQREAVEMMMHKISRLVNGDGTYLDTVVDIAGYNQLMLDHMRNQDEGKEVG
jgi:hypothetical protein